METGARFVKVVKELVDKGLASSDQYSTYELVAIKIFDSEFDDYSDGEREQYLKDFLGTVRKSASRVHGQQYIATYGPILVFGLSGA